MDVTGNWASSNEGDIARADMCYGYNTDGGCRRWEAISTCRQFGDVFEKMMGYPNNDNVIIESNVTYGSSDCMASCWTNCSCTGFKNLYHNGTGCIFFLFNSMEGVALDSTQAIFYMLVKKTQRNGNKGYYNFTTSCCTFCLLKTASNTFSNSLSNTHVLFID